MVYHRDNKVGIYVSGCRVKPYELVQGKDEDVNKKDDGNKADEDTCEKERKYRDDEKDDNELEEIDDKVTDITMVQNYKLNEDGTRNRFHIEKDEVGVKCILPGKFYIYCRSSQV